MSSKLFSCSGIGVGLRPAHYDEFLDSRPASVDWVEVISENFLDWEDLSRIGSRKILEKVRAHLPVALHGVSLSLGSVDPLNASYLKRLKSLVSAIQPVIVSDHLCWTGVGGRNFHDLLPLPFNEETVTHVAQRIARVQDFLGRRIAVENLSSYIVAPHSEMTEWEFVSEVARRADCGLLLDVNNVYVSSRNHGFDPRTYLKAIPSERVAQIHLAGHREQDGMLVDTHDQPVCKEVWDLYHYTRALLGPVGAMIERDENIPSWKELENELLQLRRMSLEHPVAARELSASI